MFNFMALSGVKDVVTRGIGRAMLTANKYSPEIFLGLGIASGVASTVFACKATLKVEEVKCDAFTKFAKIGNARYADEHGQIEDGKRYTEDDARKDTVIVYIQSGVKLLRLYAPAIGLGLLSVGLLTQSHRILNRRNAILMSAYEALDLSFKKYRQDVADNFNVDPIPAYETVVGEESVSETTVDAQGNEQTDTKTMKKTQRELIAPDLYTFVYGPDTTHTWQGGRFYNEMTLKSEEAYMNEMLRIRGHYFLNEALDRLGMKRVPYGQLVGWVYDEEKGKDNFISIGWLHERNQNHSMDNPNPPFILEFNADGVIWNQIG